MRTPLLPYHPRTFQRLSIAVPAKPADPYAVASPRPLGQSAHTRVVTGVRAGHYVARGVLAQVPCHRTDRRAGKKDGPDRADWTARPDRVAEGHARHRAQGTPPPRSTATVPGRRRSGPWRTISTSWSFELRRRVRMKFGGPIGLQELPSETHLSNLGVASSVHE